MPRTGTRRRSSGSSSSAWSARRPRDAAARPTGRQAPPAGRGRYLAPQGGRDRRAAGDPRDTAAIMQQLGMVAQEREKLEEAESWYSKALDAVRAAWPAWRGRRDGVRARDSLGDRAAAEPAEEHAGPGRGASRQQELYGHSTVDALLALVKVEETRRDQTAIVRHLGQALAPRRRLHADAAPRGDRRACQGHADRRRGSTAPGLAGVVRRREPAPGRDRADAALSGELTVLRCW